MSNKMKWLRSLSEFNILDRMQGIRSWWVIIFAIGCYFAYEQGVRKTEHDSILLQQQYNSLGLKKKRALETHQEMVTKIRSQGDPAYIEWLLMKDLGLVANGQRKVFFTDRSEMLNRQYKK